MAELVYLNGSLVPRSQARISAFDHGFLYGYGLFETMRAYHGRIFLLERHLERLLTGSRAIGLGAKLDAAGLARACQETVAANGLESARIRLTVSRGEAGPFPGTGTAPAPTVLVTANSYSPPSPEAYRRGYRAGVASFPRCRQSPLVRLKSTSYLPSVMARLEAEDAGLDESLLLNELGHITEASTSNVFFVTDAPALVTPPLASGLLPGITRQVVMELASSLGIAATESEVNPAELKRFREAFLTNSLMEIMPLVEVAGKGVKAIPIGPGKPGPVTLRLAAAYRQMAEQHTGR